MVLQPRQELLRRLLLLLLLPSCQPAGCRAAALCGSTVSCSIMGRLASICSCKGVTSSAAAGAAGVLHEGQCLLAWRRWHVNAHWPVAGPEAKPGQAVTAADAMLHLKHNFTTSIKHRPCLLWWLTAAAAVVVELSRLLLCLFSLDVEYLYSSS
jgi:hypothetical protein